MVDRQTKLEESLAHQQHLIDQLNGVVTKQRLEIDQLSRQVARLEQRLKLLVEWAEVRGEDLPHEKPPHY